MTMDEKIEQMATMLGEQENAKVLRVYLNEAKSKILNYRFPHGIPENITDVEARYEQLQIELAITLYNMRGVEGQSAHNENGTNRSWRSEKEILNEITPKAGFPYEER